MNLNVENGDIDNILEQLLKGRSYQIENNKIVLLAQSSTQQNRKITGQVIDENGEAIIGANVVVKGTTNGTITDIDGNFSLEITSGTQLQISYIGYHPREIAITANSSYLIKLTEDTQILDEVVVVGYGVQKKVNVVGSIATIDAKQLENRAQSSVVGALTGQMPGVTISQAGGQPGVHTGTIRVRGVGSFGATPDALILIDGIPGNLSDINPNDIANISVLKDAATAAIYGARAANGVVLVTTKNGQEGKISINYNGYAGFNRATALPEYVNSWEYAEALNKADGVTRFTADEIQAMKDGSRPDEYANEDFVKDLFSGNGFQTGHDLSLMGGSERSQYRVSFGYLNQNGIIPNNNYTRYTARVNLTSKLSDKLKMTVRLRGDNAKVEEPNLAGSVDGTTSDPLLTMIQQSLRFPGYKPSVLSDGS
ncbi:MAG: SusC/RagA family TonB-linked outer membrane protein [Tannerellaceae bacterium]|nr:SusC/RagA family TonB-linked outer membrane protein [Tannerellaceae bacterium]